MAWRIALALGAISACTRTHEHTSTPHTHDVHPVPGSDAAASPGQAAPERPAGSEGAPAAPAPPPYDRGEDLERRKAEARTEFGNRVGFELAGDVFLLVAPRGRQSLGGTIDFTQRALTAYFNGRFETRPSAIVSVYLFPDAAPYDAYCRRHSGKACISQFGYYDPDERTIVMNIGPGAGTLTHELVHPIVEADFPRAPIWINEGIASLFEAVSMPRAGEIHGGKNWRWPRLVRALDTRAERPHAVPAALFGMSDETFRDDREDLHYATARYFCQWLDSKNLLWPFYQKWRATHEEDPTGEKAFRAVLGAGPSEVEKDWVRWVRHL